LATIDDVSSGRQHVWEAFPGRSGETTVYLFFYASARESSPLVELYARFFSELPRYKRGDAQLVRPTFGFIPGWSRLVPGPESPHARIVLVGDAAARQSPLTYCGFGATLRSLARASDAVQGLVAGQPAPACAVDDAAVHGLTGALASVMATRLLHGDALNALLDAAFHSLWSMGNEPYARLLRDEMSPREVAMFLRRTAARHPAVWRTVLRVMPASSVGLWGFRAATALWQGDAAE
jgi:lycopene cyclase CruA